LIIINKAILHILDFTAGTTVFSEQELDVQNSVETFLLKHIEKAFYDESLKNGTFKEGSLVLAKLVQYGNGELDFVAFSRALAERFYDSIVQSEQLESCDLLIGDILVDNAPFIVIFKCNNKTGFIHQVTQTEAGIKNDIINHYAIMPSLSQRIDQCAFIAGSGEIRFADKKTTVNGDAAYLLPDMILECSYTASPKDTMKAVREVARRVAEEHGKDSVQTVAKLKTLIAENEQPYLEPAELGRQVFQDMPQLQQEYMEQIEDYSLAKEVPIDRAKAARAMRTHKIKTDTGIEISIPLEYFSDSSFVEFVNEPDGTISINLKNINRIINK
jgi:hypothetical protein